MGKARRNRVVRGPVLITETREPATPHNWPEGHVRATLTGDEDNECILVEIHGVKHYLHSTTARELEKAIYVALYEWNNSPKMVGHRARTGQLPV